MIQCHETNKKTGKSECTCKYLQLNLSSTTAAEYGDLTSLAHRLSSQSSSTNKINTIPGNTPLHLSAQHGHAAITSYLLKNGYDSNTGLLSQPSTLPQSQSSPTHINSHLQCSYNQAGDKSEMRDDTSHHRYSTPTPTPLHRACHSGALGCIQLLLDAHADILIPDLSFGDGMNAMHKAVKGGRPLAVILLLKHIKSSAISFRREVLTSQDSKHRTPLQVARDSMNLGEDEISSLRRWDVVAGGCTANFEACVKLLEQEEKEISIGIGIVDYDGASSSSSVDSDGEGVGKLDMRKLNKQKNDGKAGFIVGQKLGDSSKKKSEKDETLVSSSLVPNVGQINGPLCRMDPYQYVPTFEFLCDCGEEVVSSNGGIETMKCKTELWETAYQNSLFKSTMASLLPMTQHRSRRQFDMTERRNKSDNNSALLKHPEKRIENDGPVLTEQSEGEPPAEGCIPYIVEEKRRSKSPIRDTVLNQGIGKTNKSYLINQSSAICATLGNHDTLKVLGQPCSKCTKNSLTLFRDSLGNLVCRICLKRKSTRRY